MNQVAESPFPKRWTIANTLALLVGYILYTPIAHGVSGGHPQGLSAFQILMHSIALGVVAVFVAVAQRRELGRYVSVPWTRVPLAVTGFIAAFFAGSYQPWLGGPDWDILFGAFVLGSAAFLGIVPARGHRVAATIAVLAFPVGCFLGQMVMVGIAVATGIVPDLQASHLQHSAYWIGVGVSMGAVGGWISGLALRRMLPITSERPVQDRVLHAMPSR
jgi:hypothetical protein